MKNLEKVLHLPLLKTGFNLQLFGEDDGAGDPEGTGEELKDPEGTGDDPDEKKEKKYSDDDVDRIIAEKFAKWEKKQQEEQKKQKEADRLKNMTEQEKRDHEFKKLQDRIAKYEQQEAVSAMTKVARSMLNDENITVNDELLANLIAEDADATKANVENFVKIFNEAVKKEVAKQLRQDPPKRGSASKITKEEILKIKSPTERQRLIRENMDLFK